MPEEPFPAGMEMDGISRRASGGGIKKRKEKLEAQREETGQGPVPARQPGRKSPK